MHLCVSVLINPVHALYAREVFFFKYIVMNFLKIIRLYYKQVLYVNIENVFWK